MSEASPGRSATAAISTRTARSCTGTLAASASKGSSRSCAIRSYRPGRGKSWSKAKCSARQEFVIGGFVPSTAARNAIGSLVLGVYEGGAFRHVGRVGTGFTAATSAALYKRLEPSRVSASPFAAPLSAADARQVRFVRPELVAEVDSRGWTADGLLRQASFKGLRDDKPAREIVRETTPAAMPPQTEHSSVALTHPDRLYWPDDGVTKQGLADYYAEVWPYMAPFIVGRPLALVRCPDGVGGQTFFQKHAWKGIDRSVVLVKDPAEPGEALISIRDLDGLTALVQMATLEIHPWGSTVTDWERPDMIVMDLDPGEGVPWAVTIEAAREVRDRLSEAGLTGFVKTSGGKGLHVVAPVKPKADWPAVKAWTKAMADAMAADSPQRYVATITKAKRTGKILIDYLRNQRGMTAVAAYSTRARPGAAVSMPLAWEELVPEIGPAYFTIANAPSRLAALDRDPWEGFRAAAAPIEVSARARPPASVKATAGAGPLASPKRPASAKAGNLPFRVDVLLFFPAVGRHASAQRVHDVDHVAWRISRPGRLRLAAGRARVRLLLVDHLDEPLLDRIADQVRAPRLLALLDQFGDEFQKLWVGLGLADGRRNLARAAHLLAVTKGPELDSVIAGLEQNRAFPAVEDQARHAGHFGRAHGVANDAISLLPDLVVWRQEVGRFVPDPVDAVGGREALDVDRRARSRVAPPRARRPRAERKSVLRGRIP